MPKGDPKRIQNAIDFQGGRAQNWLDNTRNNLIPQNQDLQNRAQVAYDRGNRDYEGIQSGLQDYVSRAYDPSTYGAYSGYKDFSETGGYTPEQVAAMRARGEGAVRSTFDASRRRLEQQNRIMGGSSTARTAALAKLTRDAAHEVGDTDINLEASLADSIRQGKLAGLGGMTNIDSARMQQALGGLNAQTSAYGTRPGMADMYGGLLNQSNAQMIDMQQLQQMLANMIMQAQLGRGQMPTRFDQFKSFASGVRDLGSTAGGLMA